jgi:hypothetical protein
MPDLTLDHVRLLLADGHVAHALEIAIAAAAKKGMAALDERRE